MYVVYGSENIYKNYNRLRKYFIIGYYFIKKLNKFPKI